MNGVCWSKTFALNFARVQNSVFWHENVGFELAYLKLQSRHLLKGVCTHASRSISSTVGLYFTPRRKRITIGEQVSAFNLVWQKGALLQLRNVVADLFLRRSCSLVVYSYSVQQNDTSYFSYEGSNTYPRLLLDVCCKGNEDILVGKGLMNVSNCFDALIHWGEKSVEAGFKNSYCMWEHANQRWIHEREAL